MTKTKQCVSAFLTLLGAH